MAVPTAENPLGSETCFSSSLCPWLIHKLRDGKETGTVNWDWNLESQGKSCFFLSPPPWAHPYGWQWGESALLFFSSATSEKKNLGLNFIFVLWVQFPDFQLIATWACFYYLSCFWRFPWQLSVVVYATTQEAKARGDHTFKARPNSTVKPYLLKKKFHDSRQRYFSI